MKPVKLSSKNQIVIPKEVRKALGVASGDELLLVSKNNISYILPKKKSLVDSIKGIMRGKLSYPKNYLSNEKNSW